MFNILLDALYCDNRLDPVMNNTNFFLKVFLSASRLLSRSESPGINK